MITQEILDEIYEADKDALGWTRDVPASTRCLVGAKPGPITYRHTCSRTKGHTGPHVDPSMTMEERRTGTAQFYRWLT
jgi:hypothetical protein